MSNKPRTGFKSGARGVISHLLVGIAMGAADVIPGVSGGTVALVLGIYHRLVTAISHFDQQFIGHITGRRWGEAARHIDLGFLISLAVGIVIGILTLGAVIGGLLDDDFTRPLTLAAFFGMIAASALLVARMIRWEEIPTLLTYIALGLVAAGFAYWLTTLELTSHTQPSLIYLFICGTIAICAMILPGISGAHLLLILGAYGFVLGIIRGIVHGEFSSSAFTSLVVFASGCAVGLLAFSKVLRWLLSNHHAPTMAVLCGFMIGALRKVWPFQIVETIEVGGRSKEILMPFIPAEIGSEQLLAAGVAVAAFVFVLVADWLARAKRTSTDERSAESAKTRPPE